MPISLNKILPTNYSQFPFSFSISLSNLSSDVRWSLDLRWQRADKPVGFYGIKKGIMLRSSEGAVDIDWDAFDAVDRQKEQEQYLEKVRDFLRKSQ